jgi:hypothetical protein
MTDALKQQLDELKGKRVKNYTLLTYPLDTARSNESIFIAGSYIYVLVLDGTAKIKLNEISGDDIDLFKYRQISSPFYRIFLTHIAQATKTLTLAIGVSSETFSISDFQSPDLTAMAADISDLKKTQAYNYGTQVAKSNTAENATVVIHTITSGKTFILDFFFLSVRGNAGAENGLFVTDASDTLQYWLGDINTNVGTGFSVPITGNPFLSIPSGYKIKLISSAVAEMAYGTIKGREI